MYINRERVTVCVFTKKEERDRERVRVCVQRKRVRDRARKRIKKDMLYITPIK